MHMLLFLVNDFRITSIDYAFDKVSGIVYLGQLVCSIDAVTALLYLVLSLELNHLASLAD